MGLDYASIMGNSQGLVPDMRAQLLQDAQTKAYEQQNQQNQFANAQAQQKASRLQQFHDAVTVAVHSGDPRAISRLMIEYPEFADQLKPGVGAISAEGQQRNLSQMGGIYTRLQSGDRVGAGKLLQGRIAADQAAGLDTSDDEELLRGIQSDDPVQQKVALGTVGIALAGAAGPDKFADIYGKLNPTDKQTPVQKEYDWRVVQFGKDEADKWLAVQDVKIGPAGGVVVTGRDLQPGGALNPTAAPAKPGGGGQTSTGAALGGDAIEARVKQIVPGVVVTSRQRSAARNKAVGGVSDSYHLTGQARDFTPPKGMPMAVLRGKIKAAFPGYDVIDEGDHVHIEPGSGAGHASGPVVVKSKQQFDRLPVGQEYIAPDGSHRRKS